MRAIPPGLVSQIVVPLKDTSPGFIIMYEELLYAGKLLAQNIAAPHGYPYPPVLFAVGTLYVGVCLLLSLVAHRLAGAHRRRVAGIHRWRPHQR